MQLWSLFCPFILEGKKGTLYNSGTFHNKVMLPTLDRCPNYCSIFLSFISHQSLIQPCTLTVLFTFSPHSKLYTPFQELSDLLSSQNAPEYLPALSEKEVSIHPFLLEITLLPPVLLRRPFQKDLPQKCVSNEISPFLTDMLLPYNSQVPLPSPLVSLTSTLTTLTFPTAYTKASHPLHALRQWQHLSSWWVSLLLISPLLIHQV